MSDSKAALRAEITRLKAELQQSRRVLVDLCNELADHAGEDPETYWPGSKVEPPKWWWV